MEAEKPDNEDEEDDDNDIEKKTKKRKNFTPPTMQEIQNYVLEKKLKVDAKKFYDYFTEGNWVDSKGNKVKSWKQKLLTWNGYANTGQKAAMSKSNYKQREYSEGELDFLYANGGGIKQ